MLSLVTLKVLIIIVLILFICSLISFYLIYCLYKRINNIVQDLIEEYITQDDLDDFCESLYYSI